MTATLAASAAILKIRYPDGRLPDATYHQFKYMSTVRTREDFTGESRVVALQNENPQGSSAKFPKALNSLQQGQYNRFVVTRVPHYGIVRITGEALKAAEGDEGALVDLWKNECEGAERVELMNHEIYAFGNGSGVLGQLNGGVVTGTTVTLAVASDAAKFALGMRVVAVSTNTLSPTVRSGGISAKITGIDRVNGVLTTDANWNANIPAIGTTDYLVRDGDQAVSGANGVIMGLAGWIVGGSSPGTLYGLNRDVDPVRLAGQAYTATSVPMEEAIQEMSALAAQQGGKTPKRLWCHVRDFANLKKALGTKVTYPKSSVAGRAGVSFTGVDVEGDDGAITIMTSPFIDRGAAFLIDAEAPCFDSLGAAPQLMDWDNNNMLRTPGDDSFEARFVSYAAHHLNNLVSCVRATGFGA